MPLPKDTVSKGLSDLTGLAPEEVRDRLREDLRAFVDSVPRRGEFPSAPPPPPQIGEGSAGFDVPKGSFQSAQGHGEANNIFAAYVIVGGSAVIKNFVTG